MGGEPCTHCQTTGIKCSHDLPRQPTVRPPPYTILGILKALSRNQRSLLRTQINLEIMRGTHLDTSLF